MDTRTKIAAAGAGAALVAASLWFLPSGEQPAPAEQNRVQASYSQIPWDALPPTDLPATDLGGESIGTTDLAAANLSASELSANAISADTVGTTDVGISALVSTDFVLTTGFALAPKEVQSALLAATPLARAQLVARAIETQALATKAVSSTDLPPEVRLNKLASILWLKEMLKESPDDQVAGKYRALFSVSKSRAPAQATAQPPFVKGTIYWTAKPDYDLSKLSFPVIDVDPKYGPYANYDFATWAQKISADQPAQVVIGWGNGINNFEKPDTAQYREYMTQIRAVVRVVREVSPHTFIWITAFYGPSATGEATYKTWMQHVSRLGDGIALFNVAYWAAVPQFAAIRRQVQQDCGGKPVFLLGFYGYKCFFPESVKPRDFEERMMKAEQAARDAGFAGFVRVER